MNGNRLGKSWALFAEAFRRPDGTIPPRLNAYITRLKGGYSMVQWKAVREREKPYHAGKVRLFRETLDDQHEVIDTTELEKWDSLKLYNHSPDGFEMGYRGSGPAQLALALLLDYFQHFHGAARPVVEPAISDQRALMVHQGFKDQFVASWRDVGMVTEGEVDAWVESQLAGMSSAMRAIWNGQPPLEAQDERTAPEPTPEATPEEIAAVHPSAAPSADELTEVTSTADGPEPETAVVIAPDGTSSEVPISETALADDPRLPPSDRE